MVIANESCLFVNDVSEFENLLDSCFFFFKYEKLFIGTMFANVFHELVEC